MPKGINNFYKYSATLSIVTIFALVLINTSCYANTKVSLASTSYVNDATNLKTGTIDTKVLPIGTHSNTVAAGDDARFNTIPIGRPETTNTPHDRVLVWIE